MLAFRKLVSIFVIHNFAFGNRLNGDINDEIILFNHLPKSGGTYIKYVLEEILGKPQNPASITNMKERAYSWALIPEFQGMTDAQSESYFTICSMREPCSYYISLWSYGNEGKGAFYSGYPKHKRREHYLSKTKLEQTEADHHIVHVFSKWLQENVGILSQRVRASFLDKRKKKPLSLKDACDCWVHQNNLNTDLKMCIKRFLRQAQPKWTFDWVLFHNITHNVKKNPSHHLPCTSYYNSERARLVQNKDDIVYQNFNYSKCCF